MIDRDAIDKWNEANVRARRDYYAHAPIGRYRHIDPTQVVALRDYLGLTWKEIGERLGCSKQGARQAWGSATADRTRALSVNRSTVIDLAEALRLRALGWPWREIGQRLDCHPRSIHKALRRKGLR